MFLYVSMPEMMLIVRGLQNIFVSFAMYVECKNRNKYCLKNSLQSFLSPCQ